MKHCDTCGEAVERTYHIGGDGSWGASYYICTDCKTRYEELKNEKRDEMLKDAIEAERLEEIEE